MVKFAMMKSHWSILLSILPTAAGSACKQEASSIPAQAPPEVEVVEVIQKDVPVY